MTLQIKKYTKRTVDIEAITYSTSVKFTKPYMICEHTLNTSDTIIPLVVTDHRDPDYPIPGMSTVYRLIGDGSHSPTFSGFNKVKNTETYDTTLAAINLITFWFDGVDYWYSITLVG